METNEVPKTQTQTQAQTPRSTVLPPRHRHRAAHKLDIRHFTEFEITNPRFNGTYDISKAKERLKRFDFARTNGTTLHMWERKFYVPQTKVEVWDGKTPDIADVLELDLAGGISLKRDNFLKWIPTGRKLRENTILRIILGSGVVDLELTHKEDKQVIIPTEEPPFETIMEATYNPEFVFYALCGMSEIFKLWIGKPGARSNLSPLILASELTVAMIANIKG